MSDLPVARPGKIIAIGLNYRDHVAESGVTSAAPAQPVMFAKWPTCLIPYGAAIRIPPGVDEVDWEAELAVVIGRTARDVTVADALDHVRGYTCMNDVTARRAQRDGLQWTRAKSFDTFGPIGPRLVAANEIPDPQSLDIQTRVNGTLMQSSNTRHMIFPVAELIAFASIGTTLEAGDIIATGTPSGVGSSRTPPVFLDAGDVVEIEIEGIGILMNRVTRG